VKKESVYICLTYYHVLITIIKEINKNAEKKVDIVICSTIPNYQKLISSLNRSSIFSKVIFFDEKKYQIEKPLQRNIYGKLHFLFFNHYIKKKIIVDFKIKKVYKEVNIFNDAANIGYYLRAKKIFYNLLEDGYDHYKILKNYIKIEYNDKKFRHRFFSFESYFYHGNSKYSKIVEVNDSDGLDIPKEKIIVNKKKDMFDKLNETDKKKIYSIFILDDFPMNLFLKTKKVLLLTQPFYNDGMLKTESSQIRLYNDIIKRYLSSSIVFIKPHPRDEVSYKTLSKVCQIVDKNIPIEVLNFNDKIKFNTVVTVSSSSIHGIDFVDEKIFLGLDFLKKYDESIL
jgi:hypothetical protein